MASWHFDGALGVWITVKCRTYPAVSKYLSTSGSHFASLTADNCAAWDGHVDNHLEVRCTGGKIFFKFSILSKIRNHALPKAGLPLAGQWITPPSASGIPAVSVNGLAQNFSATGSVLHPAVYTAVQNLFFQSAAL